MEFRFDSPGQCPGRRPVIAWGEGQRPNPSDAAGCSVRSAAFPLPEEHPASDAPPADARRTVRLTLDGREHDLLVGYTVETPIWRPSYRLVFNEGAAQVQAWGIVQNVSGEDWSDVNLSLVAGAPVSFRSQLSRPVVPLRPTVTDQGAVIDAVPRATPPSRRSSRATRPPRAFAAGVPGRRRLRWPRPPGHGRRRRRSRRGDHRARQHRHDGPRGRDGIGQGYGAGGGRGFSERPRGGPAVRVGAAHGVGIAVSRGDPPRGAAQPRPGRALPRAGLASNPGASGRVIVRFVIGPTAPCRARPWLRAAYPVASGAQCIASAVRRWQFPAPGGGGMVSVNYPFNLQSAEGDLDDTRSETTFAAPSAPRNVSALAALAVQGGAPATTSRSGSPSPTAAPPW
jgi:hypothetical protein